MANVQTDKCTDRQTNEQTDGWMNEQTDEQTKIKWLFDITCFMGI